MNGMGVGIYDKFDSNIHGYEIVFSLSFGQV